MPQLHLSAFVEVEPKRSDHMIDLEEDMFSIYWRGYFQRKSSDRNDSVKGRQGDFSVSRKRELGRVVTCFFFGLWFLWVLMRTS